ncbi:Ribonuclease 3 [Zalerion maritima]|uniref:Ribonuclease 3 n=1 Tax=Zalerion maritima TaxID=339359 RepID=A0AAD5WQR1_9PEZI|nr:Ribonuclease 3 [Zalerion maritima]
MSAPSTRAASSLSRRVLRTCRRPQPSSPLVTASLPTPAIAVSLQEAQQPRRALSSTPRRPQEYGYDNQNQNQPRWAYTPPQMKGKFRLNPIRNPSRTEWKVNEDPSKLDGMYLRFLGRDGDKLLPDEIKWLAVTHKSFDQGRRGFNDRLAYFGRNIMIQEAAQYILTLDTGVDVDGTASGGRGKQDPHGREPFRHPALDRTDNFHAVQPMDLMDKKKIAKLGTEMGLNTVMRWKPRLPENLIGSGIDIVINQVIFAIVGAVALQQGSATAGRIVREKIFKRTRELS